MEKLDLHEEFLNALNNKITRRADLINEVADILKIEKDAAYRRLSGKVNFSLREAGIIAAKFNLSFDKLMHKPQDHLWLPFFLEYPMEVHSIDTLYDIIDLRMNWIGEITQGKVEAGNIYNSLPMEFYLFSPLLTKFMFFKWGNYFVGTEEFDNFSKWKQSQRIQELSLKLKKCYNFDKVYYIWDESLIWNLCREISNFHKMNIITRNEMYEIGIALKDLLNKIEKTLNGTYFPQLQITPDTDFYVSSINIGFISSYFISEDRYSISLLTNFSFSNIDDCPESFRRLKEWMDSFRKISVQISKSGRMERRLFFESQYKIVDQILNLSDVSIY